MGLYCSVYFFELVIGEEPVSILLSLDSFAVLL